MLASTGLAFSATSNQKSASPLVMLSIWKIINDENFYYWKKI
jgi:hypothetical protein